MSKTGMHFQSSRALRTKVLRVLRKSKRQIRRIEDLLAHGKQAHLLYEDTMSKTKMLSIFQWAAHEAWEKINVVETWRSLKALGRKHGRRFFVVAVLWELIEDVLFPYLAWKAGMPALIPFFLVMHFEPLVYPMFFWIFRTWDRTQGKEPWEPDRAAMSSHWRSVAKVAVYEVAVCGWLLTMLPFQTMAAYVFLMSSFGFIHERIWHDGNYGIREDDTIAPKRIFAKTATYTLVSATILGSLLKVSAGGLDIKLLVACQLVVVALYTIFEGVWSKSHWGISSVPVTSPTTACAKCSNA